MMSWTDRDPNEDLFGFEFEAEQGTATVLRSCTWGEGMYVTCQVERPNGHRFTTVRLASLVRQRKVGA